MSVIGTEAHPLRVAIIGSGPSGFYAADRLQKEKDFHVEIDMFDRLPTPFGLVRGGVAPDHQKIKSVTRLYERIAKKDNFRFYGNVEFGRDIHREDIANHYHAVIYATGAQTDRSLGIPGEDLPGSHAATEFVAWYNGHPDYADLHFDLTREAVAVIGVGNVAMDVARILARSQSELMETDIADYALKALEASQVKRIYVLGRRGPAQAAFTNPEIKEMGELTETDVVVPPADATLDPLSQAYVDSGEDSTAAKNVDYLQTYAGRELSGKPKQMIFRFLVSPTELKGDEENGVQQMVLVHNELYENERGVLRPRSTDKTETLDVGLVFRSVGYRGVALPDVPFHEPWGIIPNDKGRVTTQLEDGEQVIGDYVVGWIKRGPSGVIGTNKPDSVETVESLLVDVQSDRLMSPAQPERDAVEALLNDRLVQYVTFEDWLMLDEMELARGATEGRPRVKFTSIEAMLDALTEHKQ